MKTIIISAICAVTLAGCASTGGNTSGVLYNGTDTSFLQQGSANCANIAIGNSALNDRYPLRCGPQAQGIPR